MNQNNGSGGRRLLRPKDGRMVAGVCAGLAAYLQVDVNLVRLAFGIFSVFWGIGILAYLIGWIVLPEDGEPGSILESFLGKYKQ